VTLEFVDTNVLLYAYDPSAGDRHEQASHLVGRLGRERRGAVSVQVLQEFYVNAVRKVAVPVPPAEALKRLRARAHSPRPGDVLAAVGLAERHRMGFWDAMIVQSAIRLGCAVLWTEDLNTGQGFVGVRVSNPFVRA
jgi:predicted nucleic acid-binding protein